jgi:DNA-binding MurR/RpiR family transcriptional regulator
MFREKVSKTYSTLSPSYRRIADFLLDHHNEAAFMTATQLARRVEVNTATVVRFAQRLGYDGYPELLQDVRSIVRSRLATTPVGMPADDATESAVRALNQELDNFKQLMTNLPRDEMNAAMGLLRSARRIFVVGEDHSADLARLLAGYLVSLNLPARNVQTDIGSVATLMHDLGPDDVVVGVALTPQCPDTTSILRLARERKAKTIAIVGALSWPVSKASELAIACPVDSILGVSSPVIMTAILSALYQGLASVEGAQMAEMAVPYEKTLQRLADIRAETPVPTM